MFDYQSLQNFLKVCPGIGLGDPREDTLTSPFRFPSSGKSVEARVCFLSESYVKVHDAGAAVKEAGGTAAMRAAPGWEQLRRAVLALNVHLDEEERLFAVASGDAQVRGAVAAVIEAQLLVAGFAASLKQGE
ncbi:MAG: hypothetical protein ACFWTZ_01810 [Burkholderia sp.]|jgi:hypothetical protein